MAVTLGGPGVAGPRGWRRRRFWLTAAGAVLVVASLLPPVETLARRYLFAESIQFCVFAMAGPALIVLGAPWSIVHLPHAVGHGAPGGHGGPGSSGGPGQAGTEPGPAGRLAARWRRQPSFARAAVSLAAFIGVCLAWRLPPVLDALARHPALLAAELVALLPAGTGLWLELAGSPPLTPGFPGPRRAGIAALAMWFIWIPAYVLGFSRSAVVHAYDAAGSALGAVADQEIATGLVWAVAGLCFMPVIFATMLAWLGNGDDVGEEFQRVFGSGDGRPAVRGWGRPPRGRGKSSA